MFWPGLPGALALSWLLCTLLVAAFLLKAPGSLLWLVAIGVLACGARLMERRPADALSILPVVSLIGPITRLGSTGGLAVHLGDLYLGLICAYFLIGRGLEGPIALGRERVLIGAIVVLAFLSWCFSIDMIASIVAVIGIVELLLAYVITMNVVKDRDDAERVMWGWVGAAALSSALIILAYVRGETLLLDIDEVYRNQFRALSASSTDFLFRASFFVSSVIFPLGAATIATAVLVLFPRRHAWLPQLALGAFLVTDLLAMGLLGNKTAIFATGMGAVLMMVWAFRSRFGALRVGLATLAVLGVLLIGYGALREVMSPAQLLLFLTRFGEGESFWARTAVWRKVGDFLIATPHPLYLGLGPDTSIRRPDHPLYQQLFFGGGVQQGAVDSGFLYVVLNYGLFVLLISVAIVLRTWNYLTGQLLRRIDPLALSLWLSIVVWMVMEITQQHGVAKPALMIVQVLAIVHASWDRPISFFGRDD